MAELYSIRLYHNTGFDSVNRPSGPSVLSGAIYTDYQSNYLWQNNILAKTRIKASWQDVEDADYCRVGSMYYLITGIEMLSNMTAELSLYLDGLISIGGTGSFDIVSGWTERAHVSSNNDGLFENVLEEPWAPTSPLVMDSLEQIGSSEDGRVLNVVQCSVKVDPENIEHIAEVYSTVASSPLQGSIVIPKIPPADSPAEFRFGFRDNIRRFKYPACSFYDLDFTGMRDAINDIRSLGIDSSIINAYQLPLSRVLGSSIKNGCIEYLSNVVDSDFSPSDNFLYRYGNTSVHNNKVYAMYNNYVVLSSCSGDKKEYRAEDIYASGQDKPVFIEYSDLSPTGKPYIQPKWFHRANTALYQECVTGEEWYRVPIAYTGISGSRLLNAQYNVASVERWLGAGAGAISGLTGTMAGLAEGDVKKATTGAGAALFSLLAAWEQGQKAQIERQTKQNIVAPEITFPQDYGAQAYLGNIFFIYRTRLSENDIVRCDNFFTQFGYKQDKKFELSDLTNRQYFNYIKTIGAGINCEAPLRIRNIVCDMFDNGVRLWHVMPNPNAMTNNP